MRLIVFTAFAIAVLSALPATARAQTASCRGKAQPKQEAELLFGRAIGSRLAGSKLGVSASAWSRFVARELTPRFPDGLTITDAVGQWRDPANGRIVHERAKQVEIVLPGHADDEARLEAAAEAYKRQFHQHSVGIIVRPACVSF